MTTTPAMHNPEDEAAEVVDDELIVANRDSWPEIVFAPDGGRRAQSPEPPAAEGVLTRRFEAIAPEVQPERRSEARLLAGKYRVERVIGRSRIAITAQVRHVELQQRFLLLHLHAEASAHVDAVSRFLHGARQALKLPGEHVVRTVDAGRFGDGTPFVALEYPQGTSLRKVLQIAGPLSVSEAVEYVLQCAVAVAEAHALGMVHGTLSPTSLFLTRRPDGSALVKVLGFGLGSALCALPLDEDSESQGSGDDERLFSEPAHCLAPEQFRGSADVDVTADVWGLGAVLHELLSGSPPFQAASSAALVAAIAADAPASLSSFRPDVPASLESAVLRCLEKERHARFPSVADFASAIEQFAPAEARANAARIVRTLARNSLRPSLLPGRVSALVHVGPSLAPVSKAPEPATAAAPSRASLVAFGIGALFAMGGAAMFGAGLATRVRGQIDGVANAAVAAAPPVVNASTSGARAEPVASASALAPSMSAPLAVPLPKPSLAKVAVAARPPERAPRPASAKPEPEKKDAAAEAKDLFDDTR